MQEETSSILHAKLLESDSKIENTQFYTVEEVNF